MLPSRSTGAVGSTCGAAATRRPARRSVRGDVALRLAASLCTALVAPGVSADPSNLESGLPAEIADARTLDRGERQVQLQTRLDRERGGDRALLVEPQFQVGFTERWQGTIGLRGAFGSADRVGSGDVRAQLMHRLTDERGARPALAASVQADLPTGTRSSGVDTELRLIATRSIGTRSGGPQAHANLGWLHNASPAPDERADRLRAILGWSTSLDPRTAIVADLVREQQRTRGATASIAELGMRREMWRAAMLSVGAGVGRGGESAPRWRLVAGFEQGF